MKTSSAFLAASRGLPLLLGALWFTACSSLEHLSVLRQSQNTFNALAEKENQLTSRHVFPSTAQITNQPAGFDWRAGWHDLNTGFGGSQAYDCYTGYGDVYATLNALERRSAPQLRADGLYGNVETLRVIALWRKTFFGHLLQVGLPEPTNDVGLLAMGALSEVASQAEATVNRARAQTNDQIYPRDLFLLQAVRPLVRYDIAYINALRLDRDGRLNNKENDRPSITNVVWQMALAEEELANLAGTNATVSSDYATLARLTMLRTARTIVDMAGYKTGATNTTNCFVPLSERIDQFRSQSTTNVGSNESRLRQRLRVPTDQIQTLLWPLK
jgi:hypothetical protein